MPRAPTKKRANQPAFDPAEHVRVRPQDGSDRVATYLTREPMASTRFVPGREAWGREYTPDGNKANSWFASPYGWDYQNRIVSEVTSCAEERTVVRYPRVLPQTITLGAPPAQATPAQAVGPAAAPADLLDFAALVPQQQQQFPVLAPAPAVAPNFDLAAPVPQQPVFNFGQGMVDPALLQLQQFPAIAAAAPEQSNFDIGAVELAVLQLQQFPAPAVAPAAAAPIPQQPVFDFGQGMIDPALLPQQQLQQLPAIPAAVPPAAVWPLPTPPNSTGSPTAASVSIAELPGWSSREQMQALRERYLERAAELIRAAKAIASDPALAQHAPASVKAQLDGIMAQIREAQALAGWLEAHLAAAAPAPAQPVDQAIAGVGPAFAGVDQAIVGVDQAFAAAAVPAPAPDQMTMSMETYYGRVRTPHDAIKLFEACRQGILPRVLRRLSEQERRRAIRPGSVFVWDEREAGMRRWTDGMPWSPSRVSGSFLTYRELEGKGRGEKAGGLIKQSFSITTSAGQHLHLISYYHHHARPQADLPLPLPLPTTDPRLKIRPALM